MGRRNGNRGRFVGNVPDGWVGCPPTSTGFVDDRFFVFKTPLKSELNRKVSPSDTFSIDSVFDSFDRLTQTNRSRIGLWIDLTNTSRYYDASDVEKHGVEYKKFACEGHGQTPSRYVVSAFCHLVNNFFRRNSRDYVGIHCTHGFNRTGFFICSYLIRFRRFTPEEAVVEFAKFREPGIYRQMYVDKLFTMSSAPHQRPWPVTQPSWLKVGGVQRTSSNHDEVKDRNSSSTSSSSRLDVDLATSSSPAPKASSSFNKCLLDNRCASGNHQALTTPSPCVTELKVAS